MQSNDASGKAASARIPSEEAWPVERKYAIFAAVVLFFIGMFDLIDRQVIASLFPYLKAEFALSDKQLGMLASAVNLAMSFLVIPSAFLVDHWSRKKMIFVMALVWGISTLLCGVATGFVQLFIFRLLCGFGEAGYQPAGQSLLAASFPARLRATGAAIITAGMSFGTPVGLMLGAYIAEHWGWRHAFGVVAIPGIILAFLALRMHDFKVTGEPRERKSGSVIFKEYLVALRSIVCTPTVLCVVISCIFIRMFNGIVLSWMASYFNRAAQLPMTTASMYASILTICGSIGVFIGGPIADCMKKIGLRCVPVYITSALLCSAFMYLIACNSLLPGSVAQITVLSVAHLVFCSVFIGGNFLILDLTAPNLRATGISLMILSQNLFGYVLGPFITGAISDRYDLATAVSVMTSTVFIAAAVYAFAIFFYPRDKAKCANVEISFEK